MTLGRVLLVGAGGQLGRSLGAALDGHADVIATTRAALDVRDARAIARVVRDAAPDVVINAAAWTAVDDAESHSADAWAVNAEAPRSLAEAAALQGATLVHYSTDYVFDGARAIPYREQDVPRPINAYGASKLAGERAIAETDVRAVVLRTSWLYAPHGRNFLRTMLRLATTPSDDAVRVVDDQRGVPTSCAWLASVTLAILAHARLRGATRRDDVWGTYHVVADGEATWFEFARAIYDGVAASGVSVRRLEPIPTSAFPTPARRPAYSVLDSSKATRTFGIRPTPWREQLDDVLIDGAVPVHGS